MAPSTSVSAITTTLLLITMVHTISALNVLFLCTVPAKSHYIHANALTTLLLDRGHHVLELTVLPPAKPHPNRTSFVIEHGVEEFELNPSELIQQGLAESIIWLADWSGEACEYVLHSQAASNLLALARDEKKRPHIDVVLIDYLFSQCLGPFAKEFKDPPIVAMTAYGNPVEMDELVGGPMFPAVVPHDVVVQHKDKPMDWWKRLQNKWAYVVSDYARLYRTFPKMDAASKAFFGDDAPTVVEVQKRIAIAFVNSHPAIYGARPQLPAVIEVGGFHVAKAKDLPDIKMKKFLDEAKDGFMLMSFGSMVQAHRMEPWRRAELFRAFKRLQPLKVIMRWELPWDQDADGPLPDNVFLSPWIPQSDVLAHQNARLFVTHCGGLSTNEIVTRGVPFVGVPIMVDQHLNAQRLASLNFGLVLPYADLREDTFYNTVRTVVDDTKYAIAARRLSALFHDQPETPQERAVFWVEFVARHGGAPHLHSPARLLSWAARWMIDDILIAISFISLLVFVTRCLCGCCRNSKRDKSKKE